MVADNLHHFKCVFLSFDVGESMTWRLYDSIDSVHRSSSLVNYTDFLHCANTRRVYQRSACLASHDTEVAVPVCVDIE